jgi:hypothetical protein
MRRLIAFWLVVAGLATTFVGAAEWFSRPVPEVDRIRYGKAVRAEIETPNYERPEDQREPLRYRL